MLLDNNSTHLSKSLTNYLIYQSSSISLYSLKITESRKFSMRTDRRSRPEIDHLSTVSLGTILIIFPHIIPSVEHTDLKNKIKTHTFKIAYDERSY